MFVEARLLNYRIKVVRQSSGANCGHFRVFLVYHMSLSIHIVDQAANRLQCQFSICLPSKYPALNREEVVQAKKIVSFCVEEKQTKNETDTPHRRRLATVWNWDQSLHLFFVALPGYLAQERLPLPQLRLQL